MVWISAHFIPDRAEGRALANAALTTISIPSAIAALAVLLFLWRRPLRRKAFASAVVAALMCGLIAAAISAMLVGNRYCSSRLFLDAIPSAALGGAIAATKIAKGRNHNQPIRKTPSDALLGLTSRST